MFIGVFVVDLDELYEEIDGADIGERLNDEVIVEDMITVSVYIIDDAIDHLAIEYRRFEFTNLDLQFHQKKCRHLRIAQSANLGFSNSTLSNQ